MVEIRPKPMTEEDLMALPRDGRKFELVDGYLKEVQTSWARSVLETHILLLLLEHGSRQHGCAVGGGIGYRMKDGNVRAPDVSFVRSDRAPTGEEATKFFDGAPDLAVEIVSPTEGRNDAFRKIGEYFDAGARQVWIVQPVTRTVTVYHSMDRVRTYEVHEELDGGELLPGFHCAVSDLFATLEKVENR